MTSEDLESLFEFIASIIVIGVIWLIFHLALTDRYEIKYRYGEKTKTEKIRTHGNWDAFSKENVAPFFVVITDDNYILFREGTIRNKKVCESHKEISIASVKHIDRTFGKTPCKIPETRDIRTKLDTTQFFAY